MTGYLTIGALIVALGAVTYGGFQSTRLADARSSLATVQSNLDAARSTLDRVAREKASTERVLADERDRAVQREGEMSHLREQIAKDASTDRDGETAPVLRDTIRGLQRTASRSDAYFVGRMAEPHRLSVTIDGRLDRTRVVRGFRACRDAAAVVATELARRPELVAAPRRVAIRCDAIREGERA